MSIDRSLKLSRGLARHRNVLSRAERITRLANLERRGADDSVFGLPKVANRSLKVGKKSKKEEATKEAAAATAGTTTPAVTEAKTPAKPAAKAGAKPAGKASAKS